LLSDLVLSTSECWRTEGRLKGRGWEGAWNDPAAVRVQALIRRLVPLGEGGPRIAVLPRDRCSDGGAPPAAATSTAPQGFFILEHVSPRRRGAALWAVVATLAMVACCTPAAGRASTPRQGSFAGQIDIGGGRKLYLRCAGRGNPTVILDSGIHDSSDPWTMTDTQVPVPASPSVFEGVARFTHVCIYDRPGTIRYTTPPSLTTRSTPAPMPRKLPDMAADLHKLLLRPGCVPRSCSSRTRWPG
jgi:hypothetical protein